MSEPGTLTADDAGPGARVLALALHHLCIGHPQRTLELLATGSPELASDSQYWYLRGYALLRLNRDVEAEGAVRQGLIAEPESIPLLYVLALALTEQDRLREAEAAILTVLRQEPEAAFALCAYARLVARARQFDKAERLLAAAAALEPGSDNVARSRWYVAYLSGDGNVAVARGREYLALDPESAHAHHALGVSLAADGVTREAARHLRRAVQAAPEERTYARAARTARQGSHWLLLPLWPLQKLGTAGFWLIGIGGMAALRAAGWTEVAAVWIMTYLSICIYSWIVPPVLRWWDRRTS